MEKSRVVRARTGRSVPTGAGSQKRLAGAQGFGDK